LEQAQRTAFHAQVDRLIARLRNELQGQSLLRVAHVYKAGSFAKHTILRPGEGRKVDVDIVFYLLPGDDLSTLNYAKLSERIFDLLVRFYPNKAVGDFELSQRAATVTFIASGLSVDVVPAIQDRTRPDCAWQYKPDGTVVMTSTPGQLEFIAARKRRDPDYRTHVRLAKQWRHYQELPGLKSYSIELIIAWLLDQRGPGKSIFEGLSRFFLHLAQDELRTPLLFPENTRPLPAFAAPVVIHDPVNSANNVAGRIEEQERQVIVQQGLASWETLSWALQEDDLGLWRELFGPRFAVED
jgi:hypothetical protein